MNISPYLLSFIAICGFGSLPTLAKKLQVGVPPYAFMAGAMGCMFVMSLIASLVFEKDYSLLKVDSSTLIRFIIFGAVNFFAYAVFLVVIKRLPVTEYQLIGLMMPIIGAVLAFFLLGEAFKVQYLVGWAIICIGLFVALKAGG